MFFGKSELGVFKIIGFDEKVWIIFLFKVVFFYVNMKILFYNSIDIKFKFLYYVKKNCLIFVFKINFNKIF